MTDSTARSTIEITGQSRRFYEGVATGSEVFEAWKPHFDDVDLEAQQRVFWFYVGLVAATKHGLDPASDVEMFLAGASTRAPQPPVNTDDNEDDFDEDGNRL